MQMPFMGITMKESASLYESTVSMKGGIGPVIQMAALLYS
jgi:hypothetical protein